MKVDNIFSSVGLYGGSQSLAGSSTNDLVTDDFLDAYGYWEELVAGYNVASFRGKILLGARERPKPETWHQRVLLRDS